jgi:polysaccharide biosynthesis protein PslH
MTAGGTVVPPATDMRVSRARIALITPWHPEPVDNGSKQRLRQVIAALAGEYDLVLISLLPREECAAGSIAAVPGIRRQFALPQQEFHPRSAAAMLAALHPLPRSFVVTWDGRTAATITRIVRDLGIALVIGADLRVMHYLLALPPGLPCLLDEANTSPFIADTAGASIPARLRAVFRERKFARLLRRASHRLDAIVASEEEAVAYRRLARSSRVMIVENGVGALPAPAWRVPNGADLLYPGALSYTPNAEAVAYFARAVLPRVAAAVPAARLLVTGERPAALPPGLDDPRVHLTGWLTADGLDRAYRGARACVVPLLSGTGTRIKLLEALAYGLPVVTTTKGAEGLEVVPGEHLLIADDPGAFADAAIRLLREPAFAEALGARGRALIARRYTWDARGEALRDLVRARLAGASLAGSR